ncbi:hypothetical protein Hte_007329 [Hypoxylon texense]
MDGTRKPESSFDRDEIQWPLAYGLKPPKAGERPRRWWDYSYYRGPRDRPAQILYSDTLSRSESIARIFLSEPVLGFDMEWPTDASAHESTRLQDKVALIQIACERRIALFHIALHDGQTTQDIIAPSLRRIIESPSIIKTGVAVLNADFKKLKDIHLQPRGAFELSHLHHLVCYGSQNPELVTTKLCALSTQVEHHLGLPLFKGSVRTSNWSLPLNQTQKLYAANDAYASYLVFHCMNAKRLKMTPVPPLPKLADSYLPSKLPPISLVQLEATGDDAQHLVITAKSFFITAERNTRSGDDKCEAKTCQLPQVEEGHTKEGAREARVPTFDKLSDEPSDKSSKPGVSSKLYAKLVSHRKRTALAQDVPAYIIASNKVLEGLARHRPVNKSQLLKIHGVGRHKVETYGKEWLEIIARDLAEDPNKIFSYAATPLQPTTSNRGPKVRNDPELPLADSENTGKASDFTHDQFESKLDYKDERRVDPSQSLVFDTIPHPQPNIQSGMRVKITNIHRSKELHLYQPPQNTGLSFQLADTRLDANEAPAENEGRIEDLLDNSQPAETLPPSSTPHPCV